MINIGPLTPPVSTPKAKKTVSRDAAVAGTEINKDAQHVVADQKQQRRRGKDRRQRNIKPLIDLRTSGDRRANPDSPSVDIKI